MEITGAGDVFRIELKHGKDWQSVAEAKTLESAMLRARGLFRQESVSEARVVEALSNGRRRIYAVQRSAPKQTAEAGTGLRALRSANAFIGVGAASAPVDWHANAFDQLVAQVKPVFQRILVVAAIGAGLGTVGVLALQIMALVASIQI